MKRKCFWWLVVIGLSVCVAACDPLPPPQSWFLQNFKDHRSEYVEMAASVRSDRAVHEIDADGNVHIDAYHERLVPEYRRAIRSIGAKSVSRDDDGSIIFAMWGHGCAICDDHYMGILYAPDVHAWAASSKGAVTLVRTLDAAELPHENRRVASGFYVIPIEPGWYVYREDYYE